MWQLFVPGLNRSREWSRQSLSDRKPNVIIDKNNKIRPLAKIRLRFLEVIEWPSSGHELSGNSLMCASQITIEIEEVGPKDISDEANTADPQPQLTL